MGPLAMLGIQLSCAGWRKAALLAITTEKSGISAA